MNSIVTTRFIACHDALKSTGTVKSSRQFALKLDYQPQSLNDILKGRRDVTIEVLRKAVKEFDLNPFYLMTGEGSLFIEPTNAADRPAIVVDEHNEERIVHVPVSAQAGYGHNLTEQSFFKELPTFSLPNHKFQHGSHRCFDVSGDSMEPTLFAGDQVVCSFVEPSDWSHAIKDHFVYIIITKGDVVVKRVVNKLKENKCLELFSDNNYYHPYVLEAEDILEVWYVKTTISPFMPSPSNVRNALHEEIEELKKDMRSQSQLIKNLNSTIEMLLKQHRSNN